MDEAEGVQLTNIDLVTLAVGRLGGASSPVDLEDVAIEAYELAPSRFCWKKYPEQIDIGAVRYALKDAGSRKPALISGGIRAGYMLTKKGLQLCGTIESMKGTIGALDLGRRGSADAILEEERARLRQTNAVTKYLRGESSQLTQRDFNEFARVNDYFPSNLRRKRFLKIENAVSRDDELNEIWTHLKRVFLEAMK